ncbi:uncharacterized protein LOC142665935 isoform X2 [Rhinoderma darwinii]|uniref:uncharacterized protein LOC142665935 isoform X2 n=1 Tax=Rhinoderma darwinii TaxID=43563 RepID=UPI003F670908
MPSCIVLGCPHKCGKKDSFPGVIMHAFPRSLDRIKAWLLRTGQIFEDLDGLAQRIYDGKKNNGHRLCSAHFTVDSYKANKSHSILRPDALPSIFPPPGVHHSRRRARKQKKDVLSQLSNSQPHLLWQESARGEAWTEREYLLQGAETQTDLSCFDRRDLQQYDGSLPDKEFQHLLQDPHRVLEHSVPSGPQSLLSGLKEEQDQLPYAEHEDGTMPALQEHPRLLTSIKSENIDEHLEDHHTDAIRRIVIDSPKEEDHRLMFHGLEDQSHPEQGPLETGEMPQCIVKGCLHYAGWKYSTPGVTLHMFPKDLTLIKKWLLQTNQDFGDLDFFAKGILERKTGVFRICSAHFAPECYTLDGSQKVLLKGAIPTIFPERDKPSNRIEPAVTPVLQNIYLPISLWTNNVSMVSNIALCGNNQLINPGIKANQDNNIITDTFGVNVGTSTAESKPEERPNEHVNPSAPDFGKCPRPSLEDANTCAGLPDGMRHERLNTATETDPTFPDLPNKKVDQAIQWPEYENNVDGEPWKVLHDHFYKVPRGTKYPGMKRCSLTTEYKSKDGFGGYCDGSHSESELFSMLRYVARVFTIDKNKDLKTARILNQALEIVSLISGEFPVKCGDVAVYFTMDEWSYIDQHKEDYGDFVTDNVPMSRTWEVPEHWDSDPMTDDDDDEEDENVENFPQRQSSSDWEPDSDWASEDIYDSLEQKSNHSEKGSGRSSVSSKKRTGDQASSKSPERSSSAEGHRMTHRCDQCEEAFPDTQALETHQITHMEKCEECEELFSSKAELIKHGAENHAVKRYACTICGIQYDYKSQFVIHQRAHTGEKPFHCDACGAKFGHKSSLLVHQRRHAKGKTFKCSKCDRRFDKRSEKARHEKVHEQEKKYKCSKCDWRFDNRSEKTRHEKVHEQKKKYKCRKCGKTFVQKAAHKRHKWDHDDN